MLMSNRFLLILGLILAVLVLVKKTGATAAQGLGGAIQDIRLDGVRMGTHHVAKAPGATASVSFQWTGTTKDFQGLGRIWNYRFSVFLTNSSGGSVAQFLSPTFASISPDVPNAGAATLTVPANAVAGTLYGVRVVLEAATSNSQGTPTTTFVGVETKLHIDAVQVQALTGAAVPGGTLGTVNVSQHQFDRSHRMAQEGRPALHGEQLKKLFHEVAQTRR